MKPDKSEVNKKRIEIIDSEIRLGVRKASETQEKELSEEEKHAILKTRARLLAKEKEKPDAGRKYLEIIEFRLGSETYGIETKFVREVYPLKDFTPLPGVPLFVLGLVNVRGQILSVVDLKKFFNIQGSGLAELNKIIIIKNELMEFGIMADVVAGTHSVSDDDLEKSLHTVPGIGSEYLKGVTKERLAVLDAEKILNDPKIIINQHEK